MGLCLFLSVDAFISGETFSCQGQLRLLLKNEALLPVRMINITITSASIGQEVLLHLRSRQTPAICLLLVWSRTVGVGVFDLLTVAIQGQFFFGCV